VENLRWLVIRIQTARGDEGTLIISANGFVDSITLSGCSQKVVNEIREPAEDPSLQKSHRHCGVVSQRVDIVALVGDYSIHWRHD